MIRRILIAEDEPAIAEVLEYNLAKEGFAVEVEGRGDRALAALRRRAPDLLILDLMLPEVGGLEVLRAVRRDAKLAHLPVVVLTARGEEVDRIVGLELGADDYIPKPFSPREVVLRVQAVLRRASEEEGEAERIEFDGLVLDLPGHRLLLDGTEVALTATEFRLLEQLMRRADRVQTREQLLSEVWGYAEDVDSRTVDTHIRRLRRKLGPHAARLETVIGVGYCFRGESPRSRA